jgi:phosphoglycolate phosphatase-like HAD superfamily hydrolase
MYDAPLATLLLFDVDGTLIRGTRAARTAFAHAIKTHLHTDVDLRDLKSDGKTDLMIMQEILDQYGLRRDGLDLDALIASFLDHFQDAVRENPGEACPGVRPLLDALSSRGDVVLGLGTGNLERSARLKLQAHDLSRYFPVGGFGDDGVARADILRAGIRRAEARYNRRFDRIVVVGDTPYDVQAAAANGVWSLGVATGPFDVDVLRGAGATLAVPELAPADVIIHAIEQLPACAPRS